MAALSINFYSNSHEDGAGIVNTRHKCGTLAPMLRSNDMKTSLCFVVQRALWLRGLRL